ncbi:MAG TPA: TerC family protein, partial [Spirochaetota bacterium]|nr:TerC family protein [Spirochaetota bacterium]
MLELLIALLTLTFLEIVLGIDNIIFISIITNKLPEKQKKRGRALGLALALVFRIILLASLTWMVKNLTTVLFSVFGNGFSIREIILLLGGLFLLAKSTHEIHLKMEEDHSGKKEKEKPANFFNVII